jgi:hypothetical protein
VRLLLLLVLAATAWLVLRRRETDERRVVVGWDDGSELELRHGSAERMSLVAIAREALP